MPKTKFQDIIFSIMMVIIMVYGMICYNVSIAKSGMSNEVFLIALQQLPLDCLFAFLLEFFFVSKISKKITFKLVNPKTDNPLIITVIMSAIIVSFMCPFMSLINSILLNYNGVENIVVNWLQSFIISFPMALCFQIFYAGPFVRFIFSKIFKN